MGRASRKRASKRAGTYVDPHPEKEKEKERAPRQPFSWARAKPFIIYGVAVLLLSTLAISSLPNPWQLVGAGGVYVVATLGVIIYRTVQAGWASVRRSASIVGLIALGCLLAGWGLSFMHGTLVTNPFFGVLLGLLLAGTGRVLFPTDGPVKSPA